MAQVAMAADETTRAVHVAVLDPVEYGAAAAFMAMGCSAPSSASCCCRSARSAPGRAAGVGPALWAVLVVEFADQALTDGASHVAVVLYVTRFVALAVTMWRSHDRSWVVVADDAAATAPPPGVVA